MAYRALYRQYRPRTFSEVVGQEHITTILKNQVATGRLAHAYLFCGSRGTGKTSTAKILSRAACCLAPENGEPCNKCAGCLASVDENNPDILEIDAASNNSVEDVRDLLGQAQYAPLQLRMRVFIIDEAHMLSTSAFNALLKTLEEPPPHILFILATTEPQKLPATIISRCQRFDFHRHTVENIVAYLKSVLKKAGASIDGEGLNAIARAADGGMRDALSLADQCLSFCGDNVSGQDVYDVLGSMEQGFLFDMADALLQSDCTRAIRMLDGVVRGGRDLGVFAKDLSGHFRALLIAKTCGECADILECTDDAMRQYLKQTKSCSSARLLLMNETLLRALGDMRYLAVPRVMLESTLVRLCRPEEETSLAALEARIDRLEAGGVKWIASERVPQTPSNPQTPLPAPAQPLSAPAAAVPPPSPAPKRTETAADAAPQANARDSAPLSPPTPKRAEQPHKPANGGLDTRTATGLWGCVLAELAQQNVLVHMMAREGAAQSLENDLLSIGFDDAHTLQFQSMNAPINHTKVQGILDKLAPGTRISFVRARPGAPATADDTAMPASTEAAPDPEDAIARARALFGEHLTIE